MQVKEIVDNDKFPKWFRGHPVFKEISDIKKIFPAIGLPNSETEFVNNGEELPAKKSAWRLVKAIQSHLSKKIESIRNNKKLTKDKVRELVDTISLVVNNLKSKDCVRENAGRIIICLTKDLFLNEGNRPTFRNGEGLFRVYNKINDILVEAEIKTLPKLDSLPTFKTFSADNIPNNKFKIIFSSDGLNGAIDIGTMSSRGIKSCQSWENGQYKYCTIGSVIDPFVGIIYLTSGSKYNKYGSKMIRRCIVRFAVNKETRKPFIILDNMYPSLDKVVLESFKNFIKKQIDNKFEVFYTGDYSSYSFLKNAYLPLTETRKILSRTGITVKKNEGPVSEYDTISSYQDYKIIDKASSRELKLNSLFEKRAHKKENEFVSSFAKEVQSLIKSNNFKKSSNHCGKFIERIIKNNYNIGIVIANAVSETISVDNFTNSNIYLRQLHYSYFINKNKIINSSKTKIMRIVNTGIKKQYQLSSDVFVSIMKEISPQLNEWVKSSLKKIIEKKFKTMETLPLP